MRRDARAYLLDMQQTAELLMRLVSNRTLREMEADWAFRWAIERGLQNIGEAVFQLRRLDEELVRSISEHERIIGLRHVLVHAYDEVKPAVLWNIIESKLPLLIEEVRSMLKELSDHE